MACRHADGVHEQQGDSRQGPVMQPPSPAAMPHTATNPGRQSRDRRLSRRGPQLLPPTRYGILAVFLCPKPLPLQVWCRAAGLLQGHGAC